MLIGMYAAASGLQAQQVRLDSLANDVANVSTPGYRKGRIAFRDLVYQGGDDVRRGMGTAADPIGRSFGQGTVVPAQTPLAVAIEGPGFIRALRADGSTALVRSGELRVDGERSLVLPTGERVEPRITIPADATEQDVSIGPDGTVLVKGEQVGRIGLVDVPAPRGLVALGSGMFSPSEASGAVRDAEGARLLQGFLELSNVDLGEALVGTVEAQRSYEIVARALRMQDQALEIANGIRR